MHVRYCEYLLNGRSKFKWPQRNLCFAAVCNHTVPIREQCRIRVNECKKMTVRELNIHLAVIQDALLIKFNHHTSQLIQSIHSMDWTKWITQWNHNLTQTRRIKWLNISKLCKQAKNSWESLKHMKKCTVFKEMGDL